MSRVHLLDSAGEGSLTAHHKGDDRRAWSSRRRLLVITNWDKMRCVIVWVGQGADMVCLRPCTGFPKTCRQELLDLLETSSDLPMEDTSNDMIAKKSGQEILRDCESRYKSSMLAGSTIMTSFHARYVEKAKATDPVRSLYNQYFQSVTMHCGIGGGLSFLLARTLSSRMPVVARTAATAAFTALGIYMGGARASSLAYRDLVKQSMEHVETTEWAPVVVCPPVKHLAPCVKDPDCTALLATRVDGGQDLIRCFKACSRREGGRQGQAEPDFVRE